MTDYPIGATWWAISDNGKRGKIYLAQRGENVEMWCWATFYSDGTVDKNDWNPTYRLCRQEIPLWNNVSKKPLKFKKEKRQNA